MPLSEWFYIEKWKREYEKRNNIRRDSVLPRDDDFTLRDDVPIIKVDTESKD